MQSEISLTDRATGAVKVPFLTVESEDDSEKEPSPLDEIFALIQFDYESAKSEFIEIDSIVEMLDFVISSIRLLDANSILSFCKDVIGKKANVPAKGAAKFIILLMEICSGDPLYSKSSSNLSNVKGVRVSRDDRSQEIWTIIKASFDNSAVDILSAIMKKVDTEICKSIIPLLASKNAIKITPNLESVKTINIGNASSYFVLKLVDAPFIAKGASTGHVNFAYQTYSKENELVGNERKISWLCSKDQASAIINLMKTLGDGGLRGDVVETCSLDYVLKMCSVFDTCIDPFKLGS
jgi:hypothetical protein